VDNDERRSSVRYVPVKATLFIGWSGPRGFEFTRARILNLSLGGLAVAASGFPSGVHSAWVSGAGTSPDHSEWVCVEVQEISSEPGVKQCIRLKFTESCPYELFRTVVLSRSDPKDTPWDLSPSDAPPSRLPAALPCRAADRLPDSPVEVPQPEPASVIENTREPANPVRTAFASRWKVRGDSVSRSR
jgi:hypothetical protein